MNRVCIYLVDYAYSYQFFRRVAKSGKEYRHVVVTPLLSVYIRAKLNPDISTVIFVSRFNKASEKRFDFSRCREIGLGMLSDAGALAYAQKAYMCLDRLLKAGAYDEATLFLWNGDSVFGTVARSIKARLGEPSVKTLFCEISNIPGKLFADPVGVNMASKLYQSPELLLGRDYDIKSFQKWTSEYVASKLAGGRPPQAGLAGRITLDNILDFFSPMLGGFRAFSSRSLQVKLSSIFRFSGLSSTEGGLFSHAPSSGFVFFPMQVSTDTQLVLNSDVDNIGALELLLQEFDGVVVVKPHPVERNLKYLFNYLKTSSSANRVVVTNENTYDLIARCDEVVVINSTVGFEAMLMGKPVKFFGKSFYRSFTSSMLGVYVSNYLLNIDFFDSAKEVSLVEFDRLIERSGEGGNG